MLETLDNKASWVKDGHKTADPEGSNYAGVVSRESVMFYVGGWGEL